jgi:ribonucleoside-diphosphate reductase alpha chain
MTRIEGRGWEGLPDLSKTIYKATYFKPNDTYDKWLARITSKYANDSGHANRMYNYIHNYWMHPSTPIASDRGLPIACYVSHIPDNNEGIFEGFNEGMHLGAGGGGRGVYWGDVGGFGRPIGDYSKNYSWKEIQEDEDVVKSSGIIPFLGVSDRATYSISQANVRRSTEAAYIPIHHPDILDFIEIRLETGDKNRRMPNLHHGIVITDKFMEAVKSLDSFDLICPHTGLITNTVDAFELWMDILLIRKTEAGEPYLLFIDTINRDNPVEYDEAGYIVSSSNICTEITSVTTPDLTSVCCLLSLNLEQWDEYKDSIETIVADVSDYLTNVLLYTVKAIDGYPEAKKRAFRKVKKFILETMEIGIGVMGWHSLLQKKYIPFESPMAVGLNLQIITAIKNASDKHQAQLPLDSRCGLSKLYGTHKRNLRSLAIAPTMSISSLSKVCSSGVEPWVSNAFVKKIPQGSFSIKNKYLANIINKYALEHFDAIEKQSEFVATQWKDINKYGGSVQHLEWLDDYSKDVFKTAFEIDQRQIIKLATDRQKVMTMEHAQSINIFLPAEVTYEELHQIHMMAWEEGLNSLYYLRSQPATTAEVGNSDRKAITLEDDVCPSCT